VNSEFINAVASVTLRTFTTMISITPVKGNPSPQIYPTTLYDVTAIVGLAGSVTGTVSVQLKKAIAMKITSNMLQMPVNDLTDDVRDAIGELGNMIAGGLKTELEGKGISFDISIPTVVMGQGHQIGHMANSESLFYPFYVGQDPLVVSVSIKV
jgi:chemotaxis protein CheX